jgi:hypothetical protein
MPAIRAEESVVVDNVDFWSSLGIETVEKSDEYDADYEYIELGDEQGVSISAPKLSFKDRVGVLFGKPVQFHYKRHYVVLKDNGRLEEMPEEEAERKALRRWLLDKDANYTPTSVYKSPTEQAHEAYDLAQNHPRDHSEELIAAIAKLPKAGELLIKLPRELSPQEKRRVKQLVEAIINEKPITAKVAL